MNRFMRKLLVFVFIIVAITLKAMSSQRRDRLLEFLSWVFLHLMERSENLQSHNRWFYSPELGIAGQLSVIFFF